MSESLLARLELPASVSFISPAVDFIRNVAEDAGLNGEEVDNLHLAFEEVVTRIIQQGLQANPDERFNVTCEKLPSGVEILIQDKGRPFDPDEIPAFSPDALTEDKLDGLGDYLARHAVDELSHFRLGKEGNLTLLVKHGSRFRAQETPPQPPPESEPKTVPDNFEVRRFNPEDAIGLAKGAWNAYGYTYADFFYFPERVTHMNQRGKIHSVVATIPGGDLLGHVALAFPIQDAPITEFTAAFVNTEYRGGGIFKQLNVAAFDLVDELGLRGVFVHAVTSHFISQKTIHHFGARCCGLHLASGPPTVNFKGLTGEGKQKESFLVMYQPIRDEQERTIYPPDHHADMIETIYASVGLPAQKAAATKTDFQGDTILHAHGQFDTNTGNIFLYDAGADWEHELKIAYRRMALEKRDAIFLYLNLQHPKTPEICGKAEEWGFFFSGVLPCAMKGEDALILQYLNNMRIDVTRLDLFEDAAKELRDYIHRQPPMQELEAL